MARKIARNQVGNRKIKIRRKSDEETAESAAERQTRTAVAYIMRNVHRESILTAIRNGASNAAIADWAINKQIVDVTHKTFVGYLQYFRRAQPAMCKPQEDPNMVGYDHLFNGNTQVVDPENELLKLIALQKARIGLGFNNERNINVLMQANRKEVEELRNLLMELAKLRGQISGAGVDVSILNYAPGVNEDLRSIKQDEQQRDTIAALVADLGKVAF